MNVLLTILFSLLSVLLALFLIWCILLIPRRKYPGWDKLGGFRYAHRGLHDVEQGIPENSMKAFRRAIEHGFGAELDVHLMADGKLAVIHDSNLSRVCGKDVLIEDLQASDLKNYPLSDTEETIPLFRDVLDLFEGKTPLIVELKVERGNAAALTDAVMALLKDWKGLYCVESFHPGVLSHLKKNYPDVIRGQLSTNFLRKGASHQRSLPERFILTLLLTTVFTRPDFIAYHYMYRSCPSLRLMRRLYSVHEVDWTIKSRDVMEELERDNVVPIFEKFIP